VERITVLLADDNLIVREGVRALLQQDPNVEVVGVAGDYDELISQAVALCPQVLVTDIRMPPTFQDEGIEGAKEVRKRLPGTGVVVLSQYDSPEYAVGLLSDGAAGYAYLLKDRLADSGRLSRAIREVATGGSMLDPEIVQALVSPARAEGALSDEEEELLRQPVAVLALGDPRAGGTGPDVVAAVAGRARREAAQRQIRGRSHRAAERHGAHVGCPGVLGDRGAGRPRRARRSAERSPQADECCNSYRRRHRHAVRR